MRVAQDVHEKIFSQSAFFPEGEAVQSVLTTGQLMMRRNHDMPGRAPETSEPSRADHSVRDDAYDFFKLLLVLLGHKDTGLKHAFPGRYSEAGI